MMNQLNKAMMGLATIFGVGTPTRMVSDRPKPEEKKMTRASIFSDTAKPTFNRSPRHKHDPLYLKKASQSCKVTRDRIGWIGRTLDGGYIKI